ncbi:MAG: hypothetical protein V3S31_03045 [Dehalococcoidia bacterium]
MPRFTKMEPAEVHVGRGRAAFEARKKFVAAIKGGDAGRVDLERGDRPAAIKRLLQEAAKEAGVKVRSSWTDKAQKSLVWKKTRASRR